MFEILQNYQRLELAEPIWLSLTVALFLLIPLWKRLRPAMAHTSTGMHKGGASSWPAFLCLALLAVAWTGFAVAMARPKLSHHMMREYIDARDFVIGIDRSGSMWSSDINDAELRQVIDEFEAEEERMLEEARQKYPSLYPVPDKKPTVRTAPAGQVQRFQLARLAAHRFVGTRAEGDRCGVFTFDDSVYWVWPLSLDQNIVLRSIRNISKESGGGTNFDGPSQSNRQMGAFQATINHFEELGKARTRVMIFISDGDAGISPERHQDFVRQMQKPGQEIHIYSLVTGSKSGMEAQTTKTLKKLMDAVNPKDWKDKDGNPVETVIWAGDSQAMDNAFAMISELEKSTIELEPVETYKDVSRAFIALGAIFFAAFIGACTLFRESF